MAKLVEKLPRGIQVVIFCVTLSFKLLPAMQAFVCKLSYQEMKMCLQPRMELINSINAEHYYVSTENEAKEVTVCNIFSKIQESKVLILCTSKKVLTI
jgi:hypothetical protein